MFDSNDISTLEIPIIRKDTSDKLYLEDMKNKHLSNMLSDIKPASSIMNTFFSENQLDYNP